MIYSKMLRMYNSKRNKVSVIRTCDTVCVILSRREKGLARNIANLFNWFITRVDNTKIKPVTIGCTNDITINSLPATSSQGLTQFGEVNE